MRFCTRKLELDAAHRVMRHESKCKDLHGHRYVVEVTACATKLDDLGRVIDFGVIKSVFGGWLDKHLDHGTIANINDEALIEVCNREGWKLYTLPSNPTAENIAEHLFTKGNELLMPYGVSVAAIRVYETPNCWADYSVNVEENQVMENDKNSASFEP